MYKIHVNSTEILCIFCKGPNYEAYYELPFALRLSLFPFHCALSHSLPVSFTHNCWLLLYIRTLAGVGNFLVANCRNRQNPYPYWKMGQCNVKRETKNAFRAGAINAFLWLCSRFSVFMDNKLTMFTFACVLYLSKQHTFKHRSFVCCCRRFDFVYKQSLCVLIFWFWFCVGGIRKRNYWKISKMQEETM